jgi:primosomal protein N'
MPITLITGPANAGKAQVVMEAVRRHLAHGHEPLLIVPTREDAEHYLRELAGESSRR